MVAPASLMQQSLRRTLPPRPAGEACGLESAMIGPVTAQFVSASRPTPALISALVTARCLLRTELCSAVWPCSSPCRHACLEYLKDSYHAQVSRVGGKYDRGPVIVAACQIDRSNTSKGDRACVHSTEPLAAAWCSLLSADGMLEESGVLMRLSCES